MDKNKVLITAIIVVSLITLLIVLLSRKGGMKGKKNFTSSKMQYNKYNCINSCLHPYADMIGCKMQCGDFDYDCFIKCVDNDPQNGYQCFLQCGGKPGE